MKRIYIKTRCFCCDHVQTGVMVTKPAPMQPRGFEVKCPDCDSYNTYSISIKGDDIKISTTWVRASEEGILKYEERKGTKYPALQSTRV